MRLAIPVDEQSIDSGVCPSFGRAPFFLLYNTVTEEIEFLKNGAADSQGGAGVKAAQIIADVGTNALLTPRCGENAEQVLSRAEVLIYKTVAGSAKQNIDEFKSDRLSLLSEFHPGFHGHA